jgi:hypothetical protein
MELFQPNYAALMGDCCTATNQRKLLHIEPLRMVLDSVRKEASVCTHDSSRERRTRTVGTNIGRNENQSTDITLPFVYHYLHYLVSAAFHIIDDLQIEAIHSHFLCMWPQAGAAFGFIIVHGSSKCGYPAPLC